jgi:hypothetical protein
VNAAEWLAMSTVLFCLMSVWSAPPPIEYGWTHYADVLLA